MNTADALLQDIVEHPEDDLPRLAYADWLEETGDSARAEIIRLQLRRAALEDDDPEAAKLLRRERALLKDHPEWIDTGLGLVGQLHRGFLEQVTVVPQQFMALGEPLTSRLPIRRLVVLVDSDDLNPLRQLAAVPALARVQSLRLNRVTLGTSDVGDLPLRLLLTSPHLGGLTELYLEGCGLTDGAARDLAAARQLASLRVLDLTYNRITHLGVRALAEAAHLAGLTRLSLMGTYTGPLGVEALANSPHLRRLEYLDLGRARIMTAGVRALTATPFLATVKFLRLIWQSLSVMAAGRLASCPHLTGLRTLILNRNRLGDSGAVALAKSTNLTGLRHLGLRRNRLTAAGARAVGESPGLRGVKRLELGGNDITPRDRDKLREKFGKRWGRF
ncbi:MAG: TIGR02996 domain-containing protein [Gemmataceae bacterium]